jgi:hypothetical protein
MLQHDQAVVLLAVNSRIALARLCSVDERGESVQKELLSLPSALTDGLQHCLMTAIQTSHCWARATQVQSTNTAKKDIHKNENRSFVGLV